MAIQFYIRTAKLPPVCFARYFSYKIITLGILSKVLSLTGLNYLLLAIEVPFQCGASEIKISKLKKRKDTIFYFEEIENAEFFSYNLKIKI